MNGARTIFRQKGYLLTALAAGVLLAASSGTAYAQQLVGAELDLEIEVSPSVTEGQSARISVTVTGEVTPEDDSQTPLSTDALRTITVTFAKGAADADGTLEDMSPNNDIPPAGEVDEFSIYPTTPLTFVLPRHAVTFDDTRTNVTAFDPRPFEVNGFVELDAGFDRDAEDEYLTFTATLDGTGIQGDAPAPETGHIIVNDVDTQNYVMSTPARDMPKEGGASITVEIEADPEHENGMTRMHLRVADQDGNVLRGYKVTTPAPADGAAVINSADASKPYKAKIETPKNDKNRVADTVTIEGLLGTAGDFGKVASVDVTVADLHMLPGADAITAVAMDKATSGKKVTEIVEGGDPVYLTVTVDRGTSRSNITNEDLTVEIRAADPAQASDYDLSLSRITLDGKDDGKQSNGFGVEIMLSALDNDEDVGAEDLVLNLVVSGVAANGAGTSTGTFPIAIVDETEPKIWPLPEAEAYPAITDAMEAAAGENGFNPGESFTVMTSDLFGLADGYTASYKASVDGEAVSISASGDSLKVNAETAGSAKVTVTGKANMSSSSFLPAQTVSDEASITFEVMVADMVLVVMLEMPANVMDGNIVEGESYDIMVSANRMVMEDTEVMIMRDRAASDADDSDFTVSSATIMAGYDSATAELMVTEDMMPDGGTNDNMGESLVLYGMVDGEETNSLTFTIWDQAVPALPLFGQLLLALFLMLGGARLYRRRQA